MVKEDQNLNQIWDWETCEEQHVIVCSECHQVEGMFWCEKFEWTENRHT